MIAALEKEVEEEEIRQRKGRSYRLLSRDIEFCVYMIERHGEDYEVRNFQLMHSFFSSFMFYESLDIVSYRLLHIFQSFQVFSFGTASF